MRFISDRQYGVRVPGRIIVAPERWHSRNRSQVPGFAIVV
jgi:hypothetical protein